MKHGLCPLLRRPWNSNTGFKNDSYFSNRFRIRSSFVLKHKIAFSQECVNLKIDSWSDWRGGLAVKRSLANCLYALSLPSSTPCFGPAINLWGLIRHPSHGGSDLIQAIQLPVLINIGTPPVIGLSFEMTVLVNPSSCYLSDDAQLIPLVPEYDATWTIWVNRFKCDMFEVSVVNDHTYDSDQFFWKSPFLRPLWHKTHNEWC